jgi:oxygen-independent coproporphyrinogen III oxidase
MSKPGLYIHIPFCRRRCTYCDFYFVTNLKIVDNFISNLQKEMKLLSGLYKDETFDSIFIGGGTPSVLNAHQIENILELLHKYFKIDIDSEISIESNPEDFLGDEQILNNYRKIGINRISLGIQSFNGDELKFLTRYHTPDDAENAFKKVKKYFDNISIDIIYSLPRQTVKNLQLTLDKINEFEIPHISAYTLIFEKGTILYKNYLDKKVNQNTDDNESDLYFYLTDYLVSKGYKHYEVSNYSLNGYESIHNKKYWNYENYLGLGPGAHSFFRNKRWNNARSITKYNVSLQNNLLPVENVQDLNINEMRGEFIMLALRSPGIDFSKYYEIFKEIFYERYSKEIQLLVEKGFGILDKNKFSLTEKGYVMLDEICAKYF